jgi:hypothetical protein
MYLRGLALTAASVGLAAACFIEVKDYPAGDITAGGSGGAGGSAGSGGEGAGGAGGAGNGGSGAAPADMLAMPCEADVDCGSLSCFGASLEPYGFPGGMCSKYCMSFEDCPPGGLCTDGVCTLPCVYGAEDPSKCRQRDDMACTRVPTGGEGMVDVCIPTCVEDADCGARSCARGVGLCSSALAGSLLPMASCSLDGSAECRGCCLLGACVESCIVGAPCDGPYACVPTHPGGADGDRGLCSPTCNVATDCPGLGVDCGATHCELTAPGHAAECG